MAYRRRIVCLANSFKTGGTCIAGQEILANGDYSGWIRPVSARPTAELSFMEPLYASNESPKLLDIIDLPLADRIPTIIRLRITKSTQQVYRSSPDAFRKPNWQIYVSAPAAYGSTANTPKMVATTA